MLGAGSGPEQHAIGDQPLGFRGAHPEHFSADLTGVVTGQWGRKLRSRWDVAKWRRTRLRRQRMVDEYEISKLIEQHEAMYAAMLAGVDVGPQRRPARARG